MSSKNVKQTKKIVNKSTARIALAGINAYKVYLNNQKLTQRIKSAILIIFKRYE